MFIGGACDVALAVVIVVAAAVVLGRLSLLPLACIFSFFPLRSVLLFSCLLLLLLLL